MRVSIIASSGAARLRAEGIEAPTFKFLSGIDYPAWFLKPAGDVRSSNQLEVAMSEFELQGLELDHVGLLWGGDLIFVDDKPIARKFRGTGWDIVTGDDTQVHTESPRHRGNISRHHLTINKYRVLMTRYRKKMVIFVPNGQTTDQTCSPREFDSVANYLIRCGARPLVIQRQ